ncbi:lytic transglycosylase domain-containing protein [Eilatimonas milleporae]|uniref:Transglycosylase-like protein with SLT domain n=1 Tax=Eilatimonas milleporae TaxID=911205 RepID=A0A3M0BWL3_9PROT|nr:lytic transglycosylase domain-containing protein [Eilatimonas milleporae]RMB01981.1 transglycosylase-like protein with SLT domain [Eilatimonas milleporae]
MLRLSQTARHLGAVRPAALVVAALFFSSPSAAVLQQTVDVSADAQATFYGAAIDGYIAEAAQRFAIPERWIRAVMQAESANDPRAVSSAGAMGLMQIMPGTWDELRARYGLGEDPFEPRNNILAGTAYLREMYDRFGAPGFLAAYNAGPERYAEHLATGRRLPHETHAYIAALAPAVTGAPTVPPQSERTTIVVDWRAAPLFVARIDQRSADQPIADQQESNGPSAQPAISNLLQPEERPTGLFIRPQAENSQ